MNSNLFDIKRFKPFSFAVFVPMILLIIIGGITLYSTTISASGEGGDISILLKQSIFILVGLIAYFLFAYIDLTYLKHWQVILIIYVLTLGLLIATLLFGPTIANVKRWIIIAGIQIQPSEIAKLSVIIMTATILSYKDKYNELLLFLLSFILTMPIVALIYLQPSGSMATLVLLIWFVTAFLGLNNPFRNTLLLLIIGGIVGAFGISSITNNPMWYLLLIPSVIVAILGFYSKNNWKTFIVIALTVGFTLGILSKLVWSDVLKDYQRDRIEAFVNPEETKGDIGFNVNQSRIAIGSGQIFGKGFGNGTQSKRNFLPEYQTDFIFASYAEEFGLVGSLILFFLYGVLIITAFFTAIKFSKDPMLSLICVGIGIKILFEVFINIGTNLGTIPATGIPLPLMSAGGTSVFVTLITLGILQNIYTKGTSKLRTEKKDILNVYEE